MRKTPCGTCRRQQQHLSQSCETHSSAGFSLSLTSALEGARLMVFRDSLFSSFWGVWHGQGSVWGSAGASGWCLSCSSSLLCLGAWMCCRVLRPQQCPSPARSITGGSPGGHGVLCSVSHLSLTLGHAESKGRTWQAGKLSLPILLLQIRAQLHRSSCASLVCAAGSPSSGGFGEERAFNEGFASSGFFLCFEEHPAQLCTLSLCLPFLCKVSHFKQARDK